MPFRTEHSCMVNDKVTEIAEIRKKKTSYGVFRMVYGRLPNGKLALRSIRIPGNISIQTAQSLCISRGGEFQPATPINPQKQLLSQMTLLSVCNRKIVFNALIRDFESPYKEIEMVKGKTINEDDLPDSAFVVVLLGGKIDESGRTVPRLLRVLPYKNVAGKIDRAQVQNALAEVNQVNASAVVKRNALRKLLRIAHALGIVPKESGNFSLSDLDFYLGQLEKIE